MAEELNASKAEAVQPQTEENNSEVNTSGAEEVQVSTAPDIDSMSDEEFEQYKQSIMRGDGSHKEDTHIETADPTSDTETSTEPTETNAESSTSDNATDDIVENKTTAESEPTTTETQPYKSYKTEDEYRKDVQSKIDKAIGERLKKAREREQEYEKQQRVLDKLRMYSKEYYNSGDNEDVLEHLMNDIRNQNSEQKKIPAQEYEKQIDDTIRIRQDAEKYRTLQQQQQEQEQRIQQIQQAWNDQAQDLKIFVPSFDLNVAMQNEKFRNLVVNGMSVANAYNQINAEATPTQIQPKEKRRVIKQNAMSHSAAPDMSSRKDPSKMSDEEFQKYIDGLRS